MDGSQITDRPTAATDRVHRLLTLGRDSCESPADWPDYIAEYGFGPDDVDSLIALACDLALHDDNAELPQAWAPFHAWRALAQLRAEAAIAPLLALLSRIDEADYELPDVFALIGPAAVPQMVAFLADRSLPDTVAATAMTGLTKIGERWPDCRDDCVEGLVRVLDPHPQQDPMTNGFAVWSLIDLHAQEAIDAIRDAYRREAVACGVAGELEDVEVALGLRPPPATPKRRHSILPGSVPSRWIIPAPVTPKRDAEPAPAILPVTPRAEKTGRNEACPCGSGKKYKKCCLA